MALTPPPHPGNMHRSLEVVLVLWFLQPAALAFGFACLAANWPGAEFLPDAAAVVGLEIIVAVLTLTLLDLSPHWPQTSCWPMIVLKVKLRKEI